MCIYYISAPNKFEDIGDLLIIYLIHDIQISYNKNRNIQIFSKIFGALI